MDEILFPKKRPSLPTKANAEQGDVFAPLPSAIAPVPGVTETSRAAAASVTPKLREKQRAVLDCFRVFGPMSDEGLFATYTQHAAAGGLPPQTVNGLRPRRVELVRLGYLKDSGRRASGLSGRKAIIWCLA